MNTPNDLPSVGTEDARQKTIELAAERYARDFAVYCGTQALSDFRVCSVSLATLQSAIAAIVKERDELASRVRELERALRGLDEAYCRAGSPLTRDERFEDRKRLIAARAALNASKEQP